MTEFTVLHSQPNFPKEDLSNSNANYISYFLRKGESHPYAEHLKESLRPVHITGHQALEICGISIDYAQREYDAFCEGFAAFEYALTLVRPTLYDGDTAVRQTKQLFIDGADLADLELADKYKLWQKLNPNTYGVILNAGIREGETIKQLHARSIGASIASALQDDGLPLFH